MFNFALTKNNLIMKRPGTGISPENIKKILGRKATRDLNEDSILKVSDFF